ncbi:MAG: hypothetical protein MUD14_08645 [Hydrococcus sp. Prado102]|jgi:hypothetical protein|nr:hypothetical protein [Hydrococcus sp. Prado102]
MDNIFLGIALFLIYFCLASCVLYERKDSVTHPPNNSQPIEQAVKEMLDEIYDETYLDEEFAPINLFDDDVTPSPQQEQPKKKEAQKPAAKDKQASQVVNISKLNIRQARVACGVLGIKQKVSDRDRHLAWMQAEIDRQVRENPEKISAVYKAIADKFSVPVPSCDRSMERLAC